MTILSKEAQATIRSKASAVLDRLEAECAASDTTKSWLHKGTTATVTSSSADANYFHTCGFLHKPAFTTIDICRSMQQEMNELVEKQWNEDDNGLHSFATNENAARGDYFLESADRVHFFAEPSALDEDGRLREHYKKNNKMRALNKVGHALHLLPTPSAFGKYTFSDRVLELVTELGWKDPIVPQSMYILKQAETGGVVHSHQDRYVTGGSHTGEPTSYSRSLGDCCFVTSIDLFLTHFIRRSLVHSSSQNQGKLVSGSGLPWTMRRSKMVVCGSGRRVITKVCDDNLRAMWSILAPYPLSNGVMNQQLVHRR